MSLNIYTLVGGLGIFAAILTTAQAALGYKIIKNYLVSLLQNFAGALFVFSGLVKAVDPLGTAYKLEQYFAEFESTFAGTSLDFLAPLFPALLPYAVALSVFTIVLEIFLGVNLLIGAWRKFTSWAFFLLVLFFTFLTGFTYLTGYVPEGVNFFDFGNWGKYEPTNMKVTDCGCFGDFLKLPPYVSFLKDVFLMVPAVIFLFGNKSFHVLEKAGWRAVAVGASILITIATIAITGYSLGWRIWAFTAVMVALQFLGKNGTILGGLVVLFLYSYSNYGPDIPQVDFRPFSVGKNVAARKAAETEAENAVKVIAYRMTNKANGEVVELPFDQYLKEFASYSEAEWDLEQVKTEPTVARTKISDFEISAQNGSDLTQGILDEENAHFMLVAYKLYGDEKVVTEMIPDSIFRMDTIITGVDTIISRPLVRVDQKEVRTTEYTWDEDYLQHWKERVLPVMEKAASAGLKVYAVTAYSNGERIQDFQQTLGTQIPFFQADDILLKTIVRSNPGPVLWKNGEILMKWHHSHLPDYDVIEEGYLK